MSAPNIMSTTIGMKLPTFTIAREIPRVVHGQPRSRVKAERIGVTQGRVKVGFFNWSKVALFLLVVLNVVSFGFYIYSINSAEASQYALINGQEKVRTLQDKSRQLQVQIAESAATIRTQQLAEIESKFTAVGTPEFIGRPGDAVLTMR